MLDPDPETRILHVQLRIQFITTILDLSFAHNQSPVPDSMPCLLRESVCPLREYMIASDVK